MTRRVRVAPLLLGALGLAALAGGGAAHAQESAQTTPVSATTESPRQRKPVSDKPKIVDFAAVRRALAEAKRPLQAKLAETQLEDRFGHLLIPQKLRRDRFLKALIDQQEYRDWRAQRDAT